MNEPTIKTDDWHETLEPEPAKTVRVIIEAFLDVEDGGPVGPDFSEEDAIALVKSDPYLILDGASITIVKD